MYAFRMLDVRAKKAFIYKTILDSNDVETAHNMMHHIAREYADEHPDEDIEPNCEQDRVTLYISGEPVLEIVAHRVTEVATEVPKINFRKMFAAVMASIVDDPDMLEQAEAFYNDIHNDPHAPPEASKVVRDLIDEAKAKAMVVPANATKH